MSVDVLQAEPLREHHHLNVIEELRDLLGGGLIGLVLRRHPHLGGLFDDLLADRVHAAVELGFRDGSNMVYQLLLSEKRDAVPVIRMQPDIQNQGYAAGRAAAMSARDAKPLRALDVKALQRHLIEIGVLPDRVLTDRDSLPLSASTMSRCSKHTKSAM